jgi:hypothetical protein
VRVERAGVAGRIYKRASRTPAVIGSTGSVRFGEPGGPSWRRETGLWPMPTAEGDWQLSVLSCFCEPLGRRQRESSIIKCMKAPGSTIDGIDERTS